MSTVNLYDVLKVSHDASKRDIKDAYKKLVKEFHPDKPNGDEEMFELITEAFNVLSNEESRQEYDNIYKLSKQSQSDHHDLKYQSQNFFKSQSTDVTKKSKSSAKQEFKENWKHMDRKHNYKRGKDDDKLSSKDSMRRLKNLQFAREQDEIEISHDNLFENVKWDPAKFNAAFDKIHGGITDMIPHDGQPSAWNPTSGMENSYTPLDKFDDIYTEENDNLENNGQFYAPVNFDKGMKKKITAKDIEKLETVDYTKNHNKIDKDYSKSIEERLKERRMADQKYNDRNMGDFNTDPSCGGYGIFNELGLSSKSLSWDNDEDVKTRYKRLLEIRNRKN